MKIAFATTQSQSGSTLVGRVIPLASQFAQKHRVHVLVLGKASKSYPGIQFHSVGSEPFVRAAQGKVRLSSWPLILTLLSAAVRTAVALFRLRPDTVIIVKSLPHNTLGVLIWSLFNKNKKIILDVDDFELTANVLTSLTQRAAIHWAERASAKLAQTIVTSSPFLSDHFAQLTNNKKKVVMIPTGIREITEVTGGATGKETPQQDPSLLYVGSLSISSGHRIDLLPEILSLLQKSFPGIQLHLAGTGDDAANLKNQFARQELAKHVIWHGRFALSKIKHLIKRSDVILDPVDASITNRAKSSFRTLLAATYGLPVVTSDVGIRPYLLSPNLHHRFFAQPANPKDYTQKIKSLLEQPLNTAERDMLQKHARRFSWSKLGYKYSQLL